MLIKIIWSLIGLNVAALVVCVMLFLASFDGRNVGSMEKGWTAILFIAGTGVILLAAVPLYYSQSTGSLTVSGFFAALPLVIGLSILGSNYLPSLKQKRTMAQFYYRDKSQQGVATAIEQGDIVLLQSLIKGQNLGKQAYDDGLNYLQFAIRVRKNAESSSFNKEANTAIIRLLIEQGSATTRPLAEGIHILPIELISLLLDAGADPNTDGPVNDDPLLFAAARSTKQANDTAILLVRRGADPNAKNSDGVTPLIFAANNATTSSQWIDTWRFVRYLLEEAHADYTYTLWDGNNFSRIVNSIQVKAEQENTDMGPDFRAVVQWLKQQKSTPKESGNHKPDSHK